MKLHHHVLLDLDGTITDPSPGLFASIRHALNELGLDDPGDVAMRSAIGPPLQDGLVGLGVPAERVEDGIRLYREHYAAGALHDAPVHDGMPALLDALARQARPTAIATSKPWPYAEELLLALDLRDHVHGVAGAELDGRRRHKADVVAEALSMLGDPDPSDVVLVGDRSHDVHGAAAHGIDCIGVDWGFAEPGELEEAGAVAVASTGAELAALLGVDAGPDAAGDRPHLRRAARALVLDERDRVLLLRWEPPGGTVWLAPGGGIDAGERTDDGLRRELSEEIDLVDAELGPVLWTRTFRYPRNRHGHDGQRELWRLVRVAADAVDVDGILELPNSAAERIDDARWWTADELAATSEPLAPRDLGRHVARVLRDGPPSRPRELPPPR